jgi:hypothetical protein
MKSSLSMALLALLAIACCAYAQTTDAVLTGIVTDSSGAAVPSAQVSAVNTGTGVSREVVTNDTGAYRIGPLVPGIYELRTSLSGLKRRCNRTSNCKPAQW